jgi:hypothetical protein
MRAQLYEEMGRPEEARAANKAAGAEAGKP